MRTEQPRSARCRSSSETRREPTPRPCDAGDTTSSLRYARKPTSCPQTKPSMVSPSSCTRAIVSDEWSTRSRTSGRQPSFQNPATDFIKIWIRGISAVPARRITRISSRCSTFGISRGRRPAAACRSATAGWMFSDDQATPPPSARYRARSCEIVSGKYRGYRGMVQSCRGRPRACAGDATRADGFQRSPVLQATPRAWRIKSVGLNPWRSWCSGILSWGRRG